MGDTKKCERFLLVLAYIASKTGRLVVLSTSSESVRSIVAFSGNASVALVFTHLVAQFKALSPHPQFR